MPDKIEDISDWAIIHDNSNLCQYHGNHFHAIDKDCRHKTYRVCNCNLARWIRGKMSNMEQNARPGEFLPLLEELETLRKTMNGQSTMDEETKKERRIRLFNDRKFFASSLLVKNEDGTNNYDQLIEHIKFLEEVIKDFKTIHQAAELARIGFINEATAAERARIAEADKKYTPKFKEREKQEKEKLTFQEKKIRDFMKVGLTREQAEKLMFGVK